MSWLDSVTLTQQPEQGCEQTSSWEWSLDWTNCQMWEWFGGNLVEIIQICARKCSYISQTLAVANNISSTLDQFYLNNYTWGIYQYCFACAQGDLVHRRNS